MKLAFWNNGNPRVLRNNKRVRLPNGDTAMNAMPVPESDLYEYVESGPHPNRYQGNTDTTYENDGWTITATRTVAWADIERVREDRISMVRTDAYNKIVSVLPEWKQRNLTARAVELLSFGVENWTVDEQAEWDVGQALWGHIKLVRAATDSFEIAIMLETDPAIAADLQPVWPELGEGEGQ